MNQACIPITIESSFSVRPFHFLKIWVISIPKSKTIHVPILRESPSHNIWWNMDLPTQCLKLVQVAHPVMIPSDQSENKTFSTGLSTESVIDDLLPFLGRGILRSCDL